ncbi:fibropellin-1-like [Eublepharis macularius]|uniref:Fibropellin-1-like n=1 Tax=Eublepharis macularius TaxID=481883 RepID=A0AA97KR59_EUBMA|nr:fibropellin-1-like [Eublepharis macularius]
MWGGFSGQFCEREAYECDSSPCLNGAVCVDNANGYDCFCPEVPQFKDNGEKITDEELASQPLENIHDKNCSMDIDECAFKLCKNGASCHNLIGEFYCNCLPGFTGKLCETNIGNCLSQPCGSLSLCKDELEGYRCFCAPGFIGDNCETEVDECLSGPCQNGASCVEQLNAFSCLCSDGFQGEDVFLLLPSVGLGGGGGGGGGGNSGSSSGGRGSFLAAGLPVAAEAATGVFAAAEATSGYAAAAVARLSAAVSAAGLLLRLRQRRGLFVSAPAAADRRALRPREPGSAWAAAGLPLCVSAARSGLPARRAISAFPPPLTPPRTLLGGCGVLGTPPCYSVWGYQLIAHPSP